jgi:murein L,D-transpeptidase YafK
MFTHLPSFRCLIILICLPLFSYSQPFDESASASGKKKTVTASSKGVDTVKKEFMSKGIEWPVRYIYLRAFKLEKELEIWVKTDPVEPFQFLKSYKICATSGTFGPKRKEGDKQIPEGFYYINEFKPNSNYHLALGLNYPNPSDQMKSDPRTPGGDIYIHGNCVTIGCLPMTDQIIEEIYYLTTVAKNEGQDFIPVHIFPYRFDHPKSQRLYNSKTINLKHLDLFNKPLAEAYDFFEDTHQLAAVLVKGNGDYIIAKNNDAPKVERRKIIDPDEKKDPYAEWSLEEKVDQVPVFKTGNAALQKWLFQLTTELSAGLPENTSIAVQVQFVVDKEGNTRLPRVVKGGNSELNKMIEDRFEKELQWMPALKEGTPVATKMIQNLNLVAPEDLD